MLLTVSCGQEDLSSESDIGIENKNSVTSNREKWAPLVEIPPDRDLENLATQYGFGPYGKGLSVKSNDQTQNVGIRELFTVHNLYLAESYVVEGELLNVTDNAYWYADINSEIDRKAVLQAIQYVDEVVIFDDVSPTGLVAELQPQIVVKGGEWTADGVRARDKVPQHVGVKVFPLVSGYSSANTVRQIREG